MFLLDKVGKWGIWKPTKQGRRGPIPRVCLQQMRLTRHHYWIWSLRWNAWTTLVFTWGTAQQSTRNPGGFCSELKITSWHRLQRSQWGKILLDLILKKKDEPVRNVNVIDSVTLTLWNSGSWEIETMQKDHNPGLQRRDFSLLRVCLEQSHGTWSWREKGSKRAGWLLRITSSMPRNVSWKAGSQTKTVEDVHGWTGSSWWNSNIKRKHNRGQSRDRRHWRYTEMLYFHAG